MAGLRRFWRWLGHRLRLSAPGRVLFTAALLLGGAEIVVGRVRGYREGGAPLVVVAILLVCVVCVVCVDAVGRGAVAVARRLIAGAASKRHS